jgi:hypothetical protein
MRRHVPDSSLLPLALLTKANTCEKEIDWANGDRFADVDVDHELVAC